VNKVFDAAAVRLKYSSLVTPSMTCMYSVTDRELTTLKGMHRVPIQSSCEVGYPALVCSEETYLK
jgi:protease II